MVPVRRSHARFLLKQRKGTIHVRYQGCNVGANIKKAPIDIKANLIIESFLLMFCSTKCVFKCFLYNNKSTEPKIITVIILDARGEPRHKQKIRKWAESLKWYCVPKWKRVENRPFPAPTYGKYSTVITESNAITYLSLLPGISSEIMKGAIIINTNLDIAARPMEITDLKFFLIAQRYNASMARNICKESPWPLAAKLIRINGLQAYINTLTESFPITLKNLNNKNIESTSKSKKRDFIDMMECEM